MYGGLVKFLNPNEIVKASKEFSSKSNFSASPFEKIISSCFIGSNEKNESKGFCFDRYKKTRGL